MMGTAGSDVYVNATARLSSVGYPNGQTNSFSYFNNNGDQRLQQIWNKNSAGNTISKFDYTYNAEGMISSWTQQVDSATATYYDFKYDQVNQLNSAIKKLSGTGAIQKEFFYAFDKAGNRVSEQIKDPGSIPTVTRGAYNVLNQLTALTGGGKVQFEGTTDENAEVTVNGTAGNAGTYTNIFGAKVDVTPGGNTVPVVAVDYSGNDNTRTNNYQVAAAEVAARSFGYDANGNTTAAGGITYSWDGADRLKTISTNGVEVVSFTYDGLGRRSRMIAKTGTSTSSTNVFFVTCRSLTVIFAELWSKGN